MKRTTPTQTDTTPTQTDTTEKWFDPSMGKTCLPSPTNIWWQNQELLSHEFVKLRKEFEDFKAEVQRQRTGLQYRTVSDGDAYKEVVNYFQEKVTTGDKKYTVPEVAQKLNLPIEQVDKILDILEAEGYTKQDG